MKQKLYKLVALLLLASSLGAGALWMDYRNTLHSPMNLPDAGRNVIIEPGTALSTVLYRLAREGVIEKPRYLLWHARLQGNASAMKAGEYHLPQGMSAHTMMERLFSGKVVQYSLTIVEGWTFKQMLEAIHQHPHIRKTLETENQADIMSLLGYAEQHAEGRFLPDTYLFPAKTTDIDFLQRAYKAMANTLQQAWDRRAEALPYQSAYDALIMASIVEKETGQAHERKQIAGVFVRRLQKGMRLQTDPTVIYGMGESYRGDIRFRDLKKDTPYNTYTRHGLPPTPIALPGRDAIEAALHPGDGDALYFVSRNDGSHIFSASLEEHNRAVCKYQKKGRGCSY